MFRKCLIAFMSRKEVSFMEDKVFVSIFATYMDLWVEDRKAHGFQCKSAIGNLRQIDMYIASNPPTIHVRG